MQKRIFIGLFVVLILAGWGFSLTLGAGGFKRMVTITGVYAVCKPSGYDAICFLDADSKQGGLSCIPYTGSCKK